MFAYIVGTLELHSNPFVWNLIAAHFSQVLIRGKEMYEYDLLLKKFQLQWELWGFANKRSSNRRVQVLGFKF